MIHFAMFMLAAAALPGFDRTREADDVREAIFRHMFEHNASALQQRAGAYFLEVEHADPAEALLARFAGAHPPVRRGSEHGTLAGEDIRDQDSGTLGLIFRIGALVWRGDSIVEVEGGYFEHGLSASGSTYRLEKQGGRWTVVSDEMHWIS